MFKKLTEFGYVRTALEAFGFYLAYLLLFILLGGLTGGILGALGVIDLDTIMHAGMILASVLSVVLSFLVLSQKGLTGNFAYLLLIPVSGIAGFYGGGFLSLIIVAFLTTRKSNNSSDEQMERAE